MVTIVASQYLPQTAMKQYYLNIYLRNDLSEMYLKYLAGLGNKVIKVLVMYDAMKLKNKNKIALIYLLTYSV